MSAGAGPPARPTDDPLAPGPKTARRLAWLGGAALLGAALFAAFLFWHRHHVLGEEARRRRDEVDRGPRVFVTAARATPAARSLTLPGDVRGFLQSTLYAKIAGYVRTIRVDKGDRVRAGQVLAVLESPEVDQQVAAAEADLAVKRRTFERYRELVKKDFVSTQDFETTRGQYEVSQATLRQARAMRAYETVRAPFAGVVTARYVDPGALVPAATGSTQSALPVVELADLRRLRILVFVQQDAAPYVHAGDRVEIRVDQDPGVHISAPVSRCANALDPVTRAMLCEIWRENEHRLYPGMFVHVTFKLTVPPAPVIDSSALVLRHDQPAVAVVRDARVHFVRVRPGLDDGKTVQIVEGLRPGELVTLAPPAELADGAPVQAIQRQENEGPGKGEGGGRRPRGAAGEPSRPTRE
ncbi:MAG TPA: efflux RND transporter periplasmic adaptor subunit [Polyangia bacterium]|jgi:RND family efflux transporter MFP subunit|nr:efflux RND transporter periplasmic adaptor subunit [Polyangia bacterium]